MKFVNSALVQDFGVLADRIGLWSSLGLVEQVLRDGFGNGIGPASNLSVVGGSFGAYLGVFGVAGVVVMLGW